VKNLHLKQKDMNIKGRLLEVGTAEGSRGEYD
jgi:hypothetical protein